MTIMNDEQNSLIPVRDSMSDELFGELSTGNKYLPRIQLFGSSSKLVKRGVFPVGHYGLITTKDTADDLGTSFDCLVINVRPKAMDLNGDTPISVFDTKDAEFQRIRDDSSLSDSGCMWGPEFLLWLSRTRKYATFFLMNPTMRREAPSVRALLGNAATFRTVFIESKQYGGWHGPQCTKCTTPFDLPPMEEINVILDNFLNPTPSDPKELAPEEDRVH